MTHPRNHTQPNHAVPNHAVHPQPYDDLIELVIHHGPDAIAQAFTKIMNQAMLIERQQAIGVAPHQRFTEADQRIAYANGTKPKAVKTPVGVLDLDVPKTRAVPGREDDFAPFYPQSLERGSRATRRRRHSCTDVCSRRQHKRRQKSHG